MKQPKIIYRIGNKSYELRRIFDTSSPCCNCSFFTGLKCTFPRDRFQMRCTRIEGTIRGWHTKEYVYITDEDCERLGNNAEIIIEKEMK